MPMDEASSTSLKGKKANILPKRGQIKAQILESFTKTISSIIAKAGETLKLNRGNRGGDAGTSPPSSAGATPPFSSSNLDG
ncbi:conserved hypothetical protein [Ricinus communis]|uniref:Uncharacterized protein n=1 Tax=Ricinus communis TaxID=3988 RepID=B9SW73_RICCO|nr:conserved hypothetical protein [Ricinus communis]